jgi:hypothetical protein
MKKQFKENILLNSKHVLVYTNDVVHEDLDKIKENFCGNIFDIDSFDQIKCSLNSIIYLCGNIAEIYDQIDFSKNIVNVIEELSSNYENVENYQLITLGEVPINMYNVGVYFRKFFNSEKDYYDSIVEEHEFQSLTLSNKPGKAFRKGIYLTKVKEENGEIKFKLLRCSTNLGGPTDNFRETDNEIIDKVNNISQYFFKDKVKLNHVLAQTYHNSEVDGKQKKAKIAEHSDKTKDMPKNAIMAFCTFYKDYSNDSFNNQELNDNKKIGYDYCYGKGNSVLTKLRFRLKHEAAIKNPELQKQFDITLYPNSVFLMSLRTNRLYTHEIMPSHLSINKIPTRMGYVVRCSNTNAIFKDDQTYITKYGHNFKLNESTKEGIKELKQLYFKENTGIEMVDYDDKFYFSMNSGDYIRPQL